MSDATSFTITNRRGETFTVLIDAADYERARGRKWFVIERFHAGHVTRYVMRTEGSRAVYLHRFVLGTTGTTAIDHRNGDGLDNRRENLRVATGGQNQANRPPFRGRRYKGVCHNKARRKWQAHIRANGKPLRWLGYFETEEEAARAYDREALKLHGEFAWLNYPPAGHIQNTRPAHA